MGVHLVWIVRPQNLRIFKRLDFDFRHDPVNFAGVLRLCRQVVKTKVRAIDSGGGDIWICGTEVRLSLQIILFSFFRFFDLFFHSSLHLLTLPNPSSDGLLLLFLLAIFFQLLLAIVHFLIFLCFCKLQNTRLLRFFFG